MVINPLPDKLTGLSRNNIATAIFVMKENILITE